MPSSSSIKRVRLINMREKAIKGLFEGHKAVMELQSLVQRGNWPDESYKSLATSMCKEVGQIFQQGISRLDFDGINVGNVEIVTATPHADGFRWNKYGRKTAGGGHHRDNYRCAQKGCVARKIVEQQKDVSSLFKVIYLNHHTCNSNDVEQDHQHSDLRTQQGDGCGSHHPCSSVGPTRSDPTSEERADDHITVD